MSKFVKVIAIATGFYNGLREVGGDPFEVPVDMVSDDAWFKPVSGATYVKDSEDQDVNGNYSRMNKEALTAAAVAKGIELNGSETKAQLVELLEAKDLLD
ncbi:hypothetical protein ACINWC323_2667 [Acinetobacter sp. WC-323]|uniref:hypothetical protein n=1 Tax=Acinetobacter sp. WC-323 TaxID=903918 RepID=UPI00029E980B|nr:hypothetical protein [Acinetobacter sp. WC-323]EKU56702.1 hypothetical protein ACINWC323_2667 [Acinetobacter sp. WC-323]